MTRRDVALILLLIVSAIAALRIQQCAGPAEPWLRHGQGGEVPRD